MDAYKNKRSLKQLIVLSVGGVFLVLLSGSFVLNFLASRDYVEGQLSQHSMEAATFLGLSLSTRSGHERKVEQLRMIDALFDSGDYQLILFEDPQGEEIALKYITSSVKGVPSWFSDLLDLNAIVGNAQVMSGWAQQGKVYVQANTRLAYQELWQMFKAQLLWFSLVMFVGLLGLYSMLRTLLRPLGSMETHAKELSRTTFQSRLAIPKTRELASVAASMNDMSSSLEKVFSDQLRVIEALRDQSRKDALTGLFNREGFDARLQSELSEATEQGQGALILVMIQRFDEYNANQGRSEGDELLCAVASALQSFVDSWAGAYAARRGGAQYSVFVPSTDSGSPEELASGLLSSLLSLPGFRNSLHDDVLNIGLATVERSDSVKNLLSKADLALRQAQTQEMSCWQRYVAEDDGGLVEEVRQANHWQSILQQVLAENRIVLHRQAVKLLGDDGTSALSHYQILSRIEHDGRLIVASTFLPMARRFGMMVLFDRMVVERVLTGIAEGDVDSSCSRYHITLSEAAVSDTHFMEWLSGELPRFQGVLPRITFEVPEHALGYNEQVLERLSTLGAEWGFRLCVDRFGVSAVPFSYLQRIDIAAVKIDPSFVRDLHLNQDNQFFLRAVVQIAHSKNIQVIAIGVETQEELDMLKSMGIDAALGFAIEHSEKAIF